MSLNLESFPIVFLGDLKWCPIPPHSLPTSKGSHGPINLEAHVEKPMSTIRIKDPIVDVEPNVNSKLFWKEEIQGRVKPYGKTMEEWYSYQHTTLEPHVLF
jgi:hypothetical protein